MQPRLRARPSSPQPASSVERMTHGSCATGAEKLYVRAGYVIAGDGPVSTVASILGLTRPEMLRGVQVEAPLARPQEKTFVFLSRNLVGGSGWLFPKGTAANVGLGVIALDDLNPAALLEELLEGLISLGLIRPGILARSSGLIPVSGIREGLVQENVIFCGDAAQLTHPITGAGIPQAVFSGFEAGRAAALALKTDSSEPLSQVRRRSSRPVSGCHASRALQTGPHDVTMARPGLC